MELCNGKTERNDDRKERDKQSNGGNSVDSELECTKSEVFSKPKCSCTTKVSNISDPLFGETSSSSLLKLNRNERKVLVLYTGGTIGMIKNPSGVLAPVTGAFENLVRLYPQLHDNATWRNRTKDPKFNKSFLILPDNKDLKQKIIYKILEYDELMDSSNMSEEDWVRIARDIDMHYAHFDGFVVLHGTDTLPYTASALSFMFENIGKAVVITGSQIPIFEPRSDGADNFVTSIMIAGGLNIPEVTVYFGSKLFRGNRCRKMSADHFCAFGSPNCVALVEVGIQMEVNKLAIFHPSKIKKFNLHASMSKNVGLLRIFPSISATVIKAFCQPPIEGVVLETYGAGNMPTNRVDIMEALSEAVARGVIIVNITQCLQGAVAQLYETGKTLAEHGVLSGFDMTPEAALAKLSYVLSKDELTLEKKKEMMVTNIRGELTTAVVAEVDRTLADALASSLNIQSPTKLQDITDQVYNALILYAIEHEEKGAIRKLIAMGADVNAQNSEGKPPLHEAIIKGKTHIVEYLLKHGANVHLKTSCGENSLMTAIDLADIAIIEMLLECGACIDTIDAKTLAEVISQAARTGSTNKLDALRVAGADLNMTDELKQTPLHKAVICNQIHVVRYLLRHDDVEIKEKDTLGFTPEDYARKLNRQEILAILTNVS